MTEEESLRPDIEVFPDREKLVRTAVDYIVELASRGITENGRFSIALSGGSTPRPLYALLASAAYSRRIDWLKVHIFLGDERCVPSDSPQSNYKMVRGTLLEAVPIPAGNIHRIHGEEDPGKAAIAYEQELRTFFGVNPTDGSPRLGFDLVLLGMGDNGHTASLFPGLPAVNEKERWVMAQYVEVASMWRITLTPLVINAARNVIFIVSGAEKAERLRNVLEGPFQPEVLPAQIIRPVRGRLLWLLDIAAAGRLKRFQ